MRKSVLYLAFVMIFGLAALAQTDASASKTSKSAGKAKTEHQVTGCLSGPSADGAYTLTNGHYKKGLEVGGSDALKDHVGHEVTLMGTWAKGSEIGENEKAESKTTKTEEAVGMHKHFKVTDIKMVSDKCTANASTAGTHKKSKKSSSSTPTA
jgi:hypothetical protein